MTTPPSSPPAASRILRIVIQVLMGAALVIFGLNGFLNFMPPPKQPMAPAAGAFLGALIATGYMMKLIGATQIVTGALLLANRFVPLALVIFAPFMVNSLAFHLCLEHTGLPMAVVFAAFVAYLAWCYRSAYAAILTATSTPS